MATRSRRSTHGVQTVLVVLTFVVPMVIIYIVGLVFGLGRTEIVVVVEAVAIRVLRLGAAVLVLIAVAILGHVGTLVVGIEDAVAVAVTRRGRRRRRSLVLEATLGVSHVKRSARVRLGEIEVLLRADGIALGDLALGELEVGAGDRELARGTDPCAVALGLVDDLARARDPTLQDRALPAREREEDDTGSGDTVSGEPTPADHRPTKGVEDANHQ